MTEIIIAILSSSALSALISGFFNLYAKRKQKKDGVRAGTQILLYDRIKYLCKEYIDLGYIATNDLEDLTRMHKVYHDELNGNGFLDDLMRQVRNLEIIPAIVQGHK